MNSDNLIWSHFFGSFLQIYNLNISNKRNKMEQEVEGRTWSALSHVHRCKGDSSLSPQNTGQNRCYRVHIGYQIYVGYVYDMYTICNNYTHIGYLISVMFMQKFGDIYYRYRAHITHISGSIISGTYHIHVV